MQHSGFLLWSVNRESDSLSCDWQEDVVVGLSQSCLVLRVFAACYSKSHRIHNWWPTCYRLRMFRQCYSQCQPTHHLFYRLVMLQAPYVQAMLQSMSTNPSLVLQVSQLLLTASCYKAEGCCQSLGALDVSVTHLFCNHSCHTPALNYVSLSHSSTELHVTVTTAVTLQHSTICHCNLVMVNNIQFIRN